MSYRDRVDAPGPKKMLALDGGGIRGVFTLEVLQGMQTMLAERLGAGNTFVLADYFDYIGGTSTGAIIAAGLSMGMRVEDLLDIYTTHGQDMFDKAFLLHTRRCWSRPQGQVTLRGAAGGCTNPLRESRGKGWAFQRASGGGRYPRSGGVSRADAADLCP